jgi:dipeptidyl aminopeptidase/acylaminoacyl peptidase
MEPFSVDPETTVTAITQNDASDSEPTWSPDGTKIAFSSTRDGNSEIYTCEVADCESTATNRTQNAAHDTEPAWSPDGATIAFQRGDALQATDVYVMDADGMDQKPLTASAGFDGDPGWSSDGRRIAFVSDRDGDNEIYAMNADGSQTTALTANLGYDFRPAWSPDGSKIAFMTNRDGDIEIYVMDADGSDEVTVSNTPTVEDADPDWQTVSPFQLADSDIDGCSDKREYQTAIGSQTSGGRRDPLIEWDYFNPTGDRQNRVDDILAVVAQYFKDDNDGTPGFAPFTPGYTQNTDRTLAGPNAWNTGPPNGLQRVDDILNIVKQYFHDCV